MTIYYWTNFVKRKNSTKRPSSGTSLTCNLKEGTSVEKPVFLISGDLFDINYVKAFGEHYYYVDDVKSIRKGLTEVSCSMDAMATHKSTIGSYTAFIERSASAYDPWLADPSVTMVSDVTVNTSVNSALSIFVPGGVYTISVLNTKGSGTGFTTSYITDYTNIEYLAQYVNTNWGSAATDLLDWFQATFLHTADSIIDCVWTPIALAAINSHVSFETMEIGVDVVTGASGYRITSPLVVSESLSITIPHIYSDFRKYSPYTIVKLYIPCFGTVDINPLDFCLDDTIELRFDVDPCTGDTVCYIRNYAGKLIATYKYNVGVSCPVGKVGSDVTGTMTGLLQTAANIAGAAVGGPYAASQGLQAAAMGVNTLASALAVTPSISGSKGGRAIAENGLDIICTTIVRTTKDPDDLLATHGRILMETRQISSLSGYIKCIDASVPISGMSGEKEEVNNYLNSGFYYE